MLLIFLELGLLVVLTLVLVLFFEDITALFLEELPQEVKTIAIVIKR